MRQTLAFSPGKVAVKQDGDALVMEFTTGALKLSPWDGEIFTANLVPNGPLAAVAENRTDCICTVPDGRDRRAQRAPSHCKRRPSLRVPAQMRVSRRRSGSLSPHNMRFHVIIGSTMSLSARGFLFLVPLVSALDPAAALAAVSGDFAGLVEIGGGRKMYLECRGTGSPVVADLHALLQAAAILTPYVLVGHSTGGLIIRLYASTYPKEVAGLVLVDAIPEGVQTAMTPEHWKVYDRRLRVDPPKELAHYKDLETIDFDASFDQMRRAAKRTPLASIPLIVISKSRPFELPHDLPAWLPATLERAWTAGQQQLAQLLPDTPHLIATNSSHYVQIEQPQLVIDSSARSSTRSAAGAGNWRAEGRALSGRGQRC
jgi:hypothetical protein